MRYNGMILGSYDCMMIDFSSVNDMIILYSNILVWWVMIQTF